MTLTKTKSAQYYVAVLCAALALYIVSCAPGPLWQDSGLIQYRIWHNDIKGFFGLAVSHPLFYILAIGVKYIPVGSEYQPVTRMHIIGEYYQAHVAKV